MAILCLSEMNLINPPVLISIYLFTYLVQALMRCHVFVAIHLCVFKFYCSICRTQSRDFYDGQYKQNMLQLYTASFHIICYFNTLKWRSSPFRLHLESVPKFNALNAFFPKFNRPLAPTSER